MVPNDISTEFLPIYEVVSGSVHGFEAFAHGPNGENHRELYASALLSGAAVELDHQYLRSALLAASSLGTEHRIFVNVLPSSIAQGRVISVLEQTQMSPQQIVLEIAPFEEVADKTAWSAALHAIEALGCRLALDGFGTGWSSLTRLKTGRFEYLKVAACFGDDPVGATLFQGIRELTNTLKLRFVVTDVESHNQLSTALAARADFVQGFYLSRPSHVPLIPPPSSSLLRELKPSS